jgi:NTF2 fold immunity protein of polymorphic toxin system component
MKLLKRDILISLIAVCFISILPIASYSEEPQKHNVKPAAGYVPDEETAIKIAIAVWSPIYGKDKIDAEKPYKAILKDGVWYVSGSLPKGYVKGGVAEGEINKDDGRIIRISHGK